MGAGQCLPLFEQGAERLGLRLTEGQLEGFRLYAESLAAATKRINLTAITDPEEVQIKHFLDSLTALAVLPPPSNLRVIDIGSGAGFPGLPIKLVRPDLQLVLLDSVGKKSAFTQLLAQRLGLTGATSLTGRAEDLGRAKEHREVYDVALARAVATLSVLCEYALPFLRPGGAFVAHKTTSAARGEAEAAERALLELGGALREVRPVDVPGLIENRAVVVIDKVAPTPHKYPRRAGVPERHPL